MKSEYNLENALSSQLTSRSLTEHIGYIAEIITTWHLELRVDVHVLYVVLSAQR